MAGYLGTPTSRVDGPAKVTGAARYAAEFNLPDLVHACAVTSTIAKGRIAAIDTSRAKRVEGVIDVLTHASRPSMADSDDAYHDDVAPDGRPFRPLYDANVAFNFQPVAVVVAETPEIAQHAATLVRVDYEAAPHATDLHRRRDRAYALPEDSFALTPAKPRGDADAAFAAAELRHDAAYLTPVKHHNPMEPFGSTAIWNDDGSLTVHDKTQGVMNVQQYLCHVLGLKPEQVRVVTPFVGGAFGGALRPQYNVLLASLAARAVKRPVRLVLTRQQMYGLTYRPASIERVALGAQRDGTLDVAMHEAVAMTSRYESFARKDTIWSGTLYRSPNAKYAHKLVPLDVPTPGDMRAPGATTGVYALECAMDELAVALDIDPLALRLRNYADRDQNMNAPFTSKRLRECYQQGAARFGWDRRSRAPRSMRDGTELVGWGMATGIWEASENTFAARVTLTANGHAEVACAVTDIGTGTYTVMAQVTADLLGLPLENVTARLGDSTLPLSPVEGGSWTTASVGNAIAAACRDIRAELLRMATATGGSPLADLGADDVALADGRIVGRQDAQRAVAIADAMRQRGIERISRESTFEPAEDDSHARNTHSAVFAEVKVDEQLGIVRVTRLVSAVAAGRIVNVKTARSQIIGGLVMGVGMALHEETLTDHGYGRIVNHDFAEYHVPVNADLHDIEVIFVDEPDGVINPLGLKGVGEIGIVGVAAAIANAVWHATGRRIRDLPITLDKLMR